MNAKLPNPTLQPDRRRFGQSLLHLQNWLTRRSLARRGQVEITGRFPYMVVVTAPPVLRRLFEGVSRARPGAGEGNRTAFPKGEAYL